MRRVWNQLLSIIEEIVKEYPEFLEYAQMDKWACIGSTNTSFNYGELSSYYLKDDNGRFYWFSPIEDKSVFDIAKFYKAYDNYVGMIVNVMQAMLEIASSEVLKGRFLERIGYERDNNCFRVSWIQSNSL